MADENLISAVAGINTVAECRQLCRDIEDCNVISHFGPNSSPFHSYCLMFSNCTVLHDCPDCWSKDKVCFDSCDNQVNGEVFDNALEIITDVPDEPTCLLRCKENPACEFFTHNTGVDLNYPDLCVLQSELAGPLTACEHCRTGVSDCSDHSCSFVVGSDDTPLSSFMFTESAITTTLTISLMDQLLCELNVVAVGGGGSGYKGGGGSGYISTISLPLPFPQLVVRVGGPGEESTIGTPDQLLLSASPGGDGGGHYGGDGFCGGGSGSPGALGGEDGGDGLGSGGGQGSGLDLSSIHLLNFSLSPGA